MVPWKLRESSEIRGKVENRPTLVFTQSISWCPRRQHPLCVVNDNADIVSAQSMTLQTHNCCTVFKRDFLLQSPFVYYSYNVKTIHRLFPRSQQVCKVRDYNDDDTSDMREYLCKIVFASSQGVKLIHRQTSERQTSETTNIGKFKPQNDKRRKI